MKNRSSGLPKGVQGKVNNVLDKSHPLHDLRVKPLFERYNMYDALQVVNPHYKNQWSVGGVPEEDQSKYELWGKNCALATTAAALQLMGYDVEAMYANKTWRGFDSVFDYQWTPENFVSPANIRKNYMGVPYEANKNNTNRFKYGSADSIRQQIESQMAKWGTNSFAAINVSWQNGGAHAFIAYQDKEGTKFFDFQTHKMYTPEKWFNNHKEAQPNSIGLYRLDNQKIKSNIPDLDKIVKKRGT